MMCFDGLCDYCHTLRKYIGSRHGLKRIMRLRIVGFAELAVFDIRNCRSKEVFQITGTGGATVEVR